MSVTEDLRPDEVDEAPTATDPLRDGSADGTTSVDDEGAAEASVPVVRLAIATAFPTIAAAVMVGGVFTGIGARFYAVFAGIAGIALAVGAIRLRRPAVTNLVVIGGLFAIGLLLVVPSGIGNVTSIAAVVRDASATGDVSRPPVPLSPGWQAIIGWILGTVGFASAWVAISIRKPAMALVLPLPVAAVAAISVPESQQVASGIAVLVLFAISLGLLASLNQVGEDDQRPPLAYEVRRFFKALPLMAVITAALYFLAQANILFPQPYIDPTQEPQKPKTVPLSEVEDRVLFEVQSSITGPWRQGSLDEFDGENWRLPPFAENKLDEVPRDGIVDNDLAPGVRATFTVAGLGGAVLPGLPNTVGIVADGPKLAYDARNGNIRLVSGQIQAGLEYTVAAAALPSIEDLQAITEPIPKSLERFTRIPDPPPAVQALIDQAPKTSKWDEFDFLRTYVLENVTATGLGVPSAVPPERVQDMLAGSREGSPYEIVAAQAMLARWIGVPSRIGYGFDQGELIDGRLQVRPKNGASFVEVYFPGYKWLPVIGQPKKAKPTVGSDPGQQQFDPNILPSDEVQVQLFLPIVVPPGSIFAEQVKQVIFFTVPIMALMFLLYTLFPAFRKAWIRSRRRRAAEAAGPRSRIALAYAEWRDYATDFGYGHLSDTPLMYLDRFIDDDEHTEFAWLVTRGLWGDLQHDLTPESALAAEELSRALRRRLASAHPATVRFVAFLSRLSLRAPYAPELDAPTRKEARRLVPAPA
jgi:hypothetical protein